MENQGNQIPVPLETEGQARGRRTGRMIPVFSLVLILLWAAGTAGAVPEPSTSALTEGFVYFREGGHLKAMPKQFPSGLDAHRTGLALLEALMAGPPAPDLAAAFPAGTRVNALFITPGGDAYVDLELPQGKISRWDTITEILAVYSLVNSLTLNIPEISRVKILVDGVENQSLGGHVSLAPFFKTNMMIVK